MNPQVIILLCLIVVNALSLTAERPYYLITTGFSTHSFGEYTNTISGPGRIAAITVDEPAISFIAMSALFIIALTVKKRKAYYHAQFYLDRTSFTRDI